LGVNVYLEKEDEKSPPFSYFTLLYKEKEANEFFTLHFSFFT